MHRTGRRSLQAQPVVYDSGAGGSLLDRSARRVARLTSGAMGARSSGRLTVSDLPALAPVSTSRFGSGSVHYGVMIPDLPAPHHFLANMTVLGYTGCRAWDDDDGFSGSARQMASVSHGTAATLHNPFEVYGAADTDFAPDGSALRFGHGYTVGGTYPKYRVVSQRPDFGVDLRLTATGDISWFVKGPMYKHLSLLTRYEGDLEHQGSRTRVAGLCTFEYATFRTPYMLADRPLPGRFKVPIDFFTYQVINLDADTQLLLVGMGALRTQPLWFCAYLRRAGQGVSRPGTSVRFEVLTFQPDPAHGGNGKPMVMPELFRWTIRDGDRITGRLDCTVDTQWLYAGMGNIAGYHFEGEFQGRDVTGRGYLEYSDRRNYRES